MKSRCIPPFWSAHNLPNFIRSQSCFLDLMAIKPHHAACHPGNEVSTTDERLPITGNRGWGSGCQAMRLQRGQDAIIWVQVDGSIQSHFSEPLRLWAWVWEGKALLKHSSRSPNPSFPSSQKLWAHFLHCIQAWTQSCPWPSNNLDFPTNQGPDTLLASSFVRIYHLHCTFV